VLATRKVTAAGRCSGRPDSAMTWSADRLRSSGSRLQARARAAAAPAWKRWTTPTGRGASQTTGALMMLTSIRLHLHRRRNSCSSAAAGLTGKVLLLHHGPIKTWCFTFVRIFANYSPIFQIHLLAHSADSLH